MTIANLSTYDEVLKTFYLPGIQDALNHDTPLADLIDVNEEDVSGKNATIETHYGRSTGTKWTTDGGTMPTATYQKYKTCTVPMKYGYAQIRLTGPTMRATKDSRGAYIQALDSEIRGIVDDFKKEVNRQYFGTGYGILGRWRSGATTSQTVQKKYTGNSAGGDGWGSAMGAKYLVERGDAVNVILATTTNYVVGTTDMAVSAVTKGAEYDTITCTDPTGTEAAGTFYIRPAGLVAIAAIGNAHRMEMMGLGGIVGDDDLDDIAIGATYGAGTSDFNDPLQGLDIATYPWWTAITDFHASGRFAGQRALDLTLMQTMFDMIEERAGKGYGPDLMMTTRAVRREYLELCKADSRTVNTMALDGGWTALDYNGVPLMVDNDALDGEILFLTLKDLQLYRMSDYEWMEQNGAILRIVTGYDAYEATFFRYAELGCKNRRNQGLLGSLAYTKSTNEGY
jgi:hypothetical protein